MYLDQAVIFVVIQVFPCALFPVLRMRLNGSPIDAICPSLPGLSFLSARALDTSFSFCSPAVLELPPVLIFPGVPDFRSVHHVHPAQGSLGNQACHVCRADMRSRRKIALNKSTIYLIQSENNKPFI